jgi:hypothetical protein
MDQTDSTRKPNVWCAHVIRRLPGCLGSRRPGDYAYIGVAEVPMKITNTFRQNGEVWNNVVYYTSTWATKDEALNAVRAAFPKARITR